MVVLSGAFIIARAHILSWINLGVSVSTDHHVIAARAEHDPGERDSLLSVRSNAVHAITFRFSLPDVFQVFLCSGWYHRLGSTPEAIDEGLTLDGDSVTILHLGRFLHGHYISLPDSLLVTFLFVSSQLKSTPFFEEVARLFD